MKKIILRHGDLLLKPIKQIGKGMKKSNDMVLAYGELTGHHHRLEGDVEVYRLGEQTQVLVKGKTELTHQEHKTIQIPEGIYELVREREFDPYADAIRKVQD